MPFGTRQVPPVHVCELLFSKTHFGSDVWKVSSNLRLCKHGYRHSCRYLIFLCDPLSALPPQCTTEEKNSAHIGFIVDETFSCTCQTFRFLIQVVPNWKVTAWKSGRIIALCLQMTESAKSELWRQRGHRNAAWEPDAGISPAVLTDKNDGSKCEPRGLRWLNKLRSEGTEISSSDGGQKDAGLCQKSKLWSFETCHVQSTMSEVIYGRGK